MKRFHSQRLPYTPFSRAAVQPYARRRVRRRAARAPALRGRRAGYLRRGGYYGRYTPGMGEMKFHDVDVDDAAIAANGTIQNTGSVNLIPQGITEKTRIGRKCTIKAINWRFNISVANVDQGAAKADEIRVILYLDKQCNGATAAVADILESDNYQSFNNLANSSRFRTLMDRCYVIEQKAGAYDGTGTDWVGTNISDTLFKKVDISLEFSAAAGALTEIRSNNIGVLILAKSGSGVAFDSKMRLRFSDT